MPPQQPSRRAGLPQDEEQQDGGAHTPAAQSTRSGSDLPRRPPLKRSRCSEAGEQQGLERGQHNEIPFSQAVPMLGTASTSTDSALMAVAAAGSSLQPAGAQAPVHQGGRNGVAAMGIDLGAALAPNLMVRQGRNNTWRVEERIDGGKFDLLGVFGDQLSANRHYNACVAAFGENCPILPGGYPPDAVGPRFEG